MTHASFDNQKHYKTLPVVATDIRAKARPLWDVLDEQLEEAHTTGVDLPNCYENPALFADYTEQISDPMAQELCAGCPLLIACGAYAKIERPNDGIYGGVNYFRKDWEHD